MYAQTTPFSTVNLNPDYKFDSLSKKKKHSQFQQKSEDVLFLPLIVWFLAVLEQGSCECTHRPALLAKMDCHLTHLKHKSGDKL